MAAGDTGESCPTSTAGNAERRSSHSPASSTASSRSQKPFQRKTSFSGRSPGQPGAAASGGSGPSSGGYRRPRREQPLLVLKVGTSSLMVSDSTGQRVRLANMSNLVELIGLLRRKGFQVILVSSGAVGMGCIKLGISKPSSLRKKQAVAAAGQSHLMRIYEDLFNTVGLKCAQLLLSQSDFMEKEHWTNVKHTMMECLELGVVPVINENDCTSTVEMRFGDNDNLAALTAVQMEADGLFLFTDVDYLYTANPRADPTAKALRVVEEPWALQVDTREAGSGLGTGGMMTKIIAARTASTAGIPCGLINGQHPDRLITFLDYGILSEEPAPPSPSGVAGDAAKAAAADPKKDGAAAPLPEGTYFKAKAHDQTVGETRRWILSLPVVGEVTIDDGAARALANKKSLLPVGVLKVSGNFVSHECIKIIHRSSEVGRAIVNYSSEDLLQIRGRNSKDYDEILGYSAPTEGCYRDNIILTVAAETLRSIDVLTKLP